MEAFPTLKYVSREELAAWLQAKDTPATAAAEGGSEEASTAQKPKIAVVDVRDSGGHIKSSLHRPSQAFSSQLDNILAELSGYDKVVFHCALSQQRGPSAALKYQRSKAALENLKKSAGKEEQELVFGKVGGKNEQEVYVLDGGFVKWQEKYSADEGLTEGWRKDVWEGGFYDY
ncbi:hypothetical protein H072_10130 [Dactylellina haptotyla CBS 200.50]|uniref:Rhodanese domain-containing protein n=1 Tax=Dactylellina haptotyla (strain CBS 200.50) TaxID=1284197 RepID=S8A052_DACHA|nr:hypothetical protein H072_10130 [Dactylellina haptotyla CBS 200.50]